MLNNKQFEDSYCQKLDKKKPALGKRGKILCSMIFGLTIISAISFLVCINDIAIKGFVIKDLQTKLRNLSNETEEIEIKIAELKNLDKIYNRAKQFKMVKVDKIDYVVVQDSSVAKK